MHTDTARLQLDLLRFRSQTIDLLTGAHRAEDDRFADVLAQRGDGLSADGRNLALRDPESGYAMMSRINGYEQSFKAQSALLTQMREAVDSLGRDGAQIEALDASDTDSEIATRLQAFIDRYNAWEDSYDQDVESGGVLANVDAATIARTSLEQSMRNIFNGSVEGVNGLGALGVRIDPVTRQASLDTTRLTAQLKDNRAGAIAALDAFAADIERTAQTLTGDDNVFAHQIDNRDRALGFIATHRAALSAEFGTGAAAQPSAAVAKAAAYYDALHSTGGLG